MNTTHKKCIFHVCVYSDPGGQIPSKLNRCVCLANIIKNAKFRRYNVFYALRNLHFHVATEKPGRAYDSGMHPRAVSDQILVIAMHTVAIKFIMSLLRNHVVYLSYKH